MRTVYTSKSVDTCNCQVYELLTFIAPYAANIRFLNQSEPLLFDKQNFVVAFSMLVPQNGWSLERLIFVIWTVWKLLRPSGKNESERLRVLRWLFHPLFESICVDYIKHYVFCTLCRQSWPCQRFEWLPSCMWVCFSWRDGDHWKFEIRCIWSRGNSLCCHWNHYMYLGSFQCILI